MAGRIPPGPGSAWQDRRPLADPEPDRRATSGRRASGKGHTGAARRHLRLRGRASSGARRLGRVRGGRARRARRRHRRRQVNAGEATYASVRPAARRDRFRRGRSAAGDARLAASPDRDAAPGRPSVQRNDRGQRPARRAGSFGRGRCPRARPDRRPRAVRIAAGRLADRRPDARGAALGRRAPARRHCPRRTCGSRGDRSR